MPAKMPHHQVSFEDITKDLIRLVTSHKLRVENIMSKQKGQPELHTK